jgi:hypothetical protein
VPANITIILLPPKCPELNPVENVWQFMRDMGFIFRGCPASDLLLFAKHLFVASTSAYAAVITLMQLTRPRLRAISTAVLTASSRLSV